jgi:hypothetical protein
VTVGQTDVRPQPQRPQSVNATKNIEIPRQRHIAEYERLVRGKTLRHSERRLFIPALGSHLVLHGLAD